MGTPPVPTRARTPTGRRSPAASVAGSESSGVTDTERRTPTGNGGMAAGGFGGAGGAGGGGDRPNSAVRVVVRVRPQNKKEIEAGGTVCVSFPSEVCSALFCCCCCFHVSTDTGLNSSLFVFPYSLFLQLAGAPAASPSAAPVSCLCVFMWAGHAAQSPLQREQTLSAPQRTRPRPFSPSPSNVRFKRHIKRKRSNDRQLSRSDMTDANLMSLPRAFHLNCPRAPFGN